MKLYIFSSIFVPALGFTTNIRPFVNIPVTRTESKPVVGRYSYPTLRPNNNEYAATASSHGLLKMSTDAETATKEVCSKNGDFDVNVALFCAGLAFDAYAKPPANSSRWERGVSTCTMP